MGRSITEEINVGKRLGRLLQQYALRIAYAEGKIQLYDEEQQNASARGNGVKTLKATVAKNCWEVYAKNLKTKKEELEKSIREALVGYSTKQRQIWFAYFIENKSSYEIEEEQCINSRAVQRMVASMKEDMDLRFDIKVPNIGEKKFPKFSPKDLAEFLTEKPSEDYVLAIKDLLNYGIVDLDELDFDPDFQGWINSGEDK